MFDEWRHGNHFMHTWESWSEINEKKMLRNGFKNATTTTSRTVDGVMRCKMWNKRCCQWTRRSFFSDLNHPRHATKKGIEDAFCESNIYVVLNLFLKNLKFINFSIRQCLIDLHKNIIKSLFQNAIKHNIARMIFFINSNHIQHSHHKVHCWIHQRRRQTRGNKK